MERIWLKQYPAGVPADIDPNEYSSLTVLIEKCYQRFSEKIAYSNLGTGFRYREMEQYSRTMAAYLQQVAGLQRGDRIAMMLPNILQYPVAVHGALRAGLTVVNVNPLYTARELEHQLKDSGARAIIILENFCPALEDALPNCPSIEQVYVTRMGDMFPVLKGAIVNFVVSRVKKLVPPWSIPQAIPFRTMIKQGRKHNLVPVELNHDDIAFLQYTGGTTGVSKGAMLTHRNMVANVLQATEWMKPVTIEGGEVLITALPLYHIFALLANAFVYMNLGGEKVLITNPRDYAGFIKELGKIEFTGITGVNTLFNAMLHTPGFDQLDFSKFRVALAGGMALQEAVAKRWKEVTGIPIIEAYGLTETSPAACMNPMTNQEFNGSIGVPIPSTYACIRDERGNDLPVGEVGELCLKGPQVMRGYWQRPEDTADVLSEDGWLRTGDIARMDEQGYFYIEDRKKDMILVSGFNVYPNEIEGVVVEHPGILEAAAIGVPHERTGETIKLFVVRKDPTLTAEALEAWCREQMTAYKVPKFIEFRDELPKSNVGKILRRALREEA